MAMNPIQAAVERSFDRFASKIGLAVPTGNGDNQGRQESANVNRTKTAEDQRGNPNQTQQEAGDYGTQQQAVSAQQSETRGAAPAGTESRGNPTATMNPKDQQYGLNGSATLASVAASRAVADLASRGQASQGAQLLRHLAAGDAPADLGTEVGGKPESVEAGEEAEDQDVSAAPDAPGQTPGMGGTPMDGAAVGEIEKKLRDVEEQKKVLTEVGSQLGDILKGLGVGMASRRKKKAGPADRTAPPKVQPKNVPESSMQDVGQDYEQADGDGDEAARSVANQTSTKEDKTHNGAEHQDRGDYKIGSVDWKLYDRIGQVRTAALRQVARKIAAKAGLSKGAVFTRQHYQMIANLLSQIPEGQREQIANALSDMFSQDNPRFDKSKFLAACGGERVPMRGFPEKKRSLGLPPKGTEARRKRAGLRKGAGKISFNLLDVCLSDYFQGHSGDVVAVPVGAKSTAQDVADEIVQEMHGYLGVNYLSELDQAALDAISDEQIKAAATEAAEGIEHHLGYIEEGEEGEEDMGDSVYAYFSVDYDDEGESEEHEASESPAEEKAEHEASRKRRIAAKVRRIQALRRKKADDGPDDRARSAGGDEENRYESALQGDTADDEIADGNIDTLSSPETERVSDEAQSRLDREHSTAVKGSTVANRLPVHQRRIVESRLESFEKMGGRLLTAAKALTKRRASLKAPVLADAKALLREFGSLRTRIATAMRQNDPQAVNRFMHIVAALPGYIKGASIAAGTMEIMAQYEDAVVQKQAQAGNAAKLASVQVRWGQITEAARDKAVADYIQMSPEQFQATVEAAKRIGDITTRTAAKRGHEDGPRMARRLASVVTAAPADLAPRDDLEGIFDDDNN